MGWRIELKIAGISVRLRVEGLPSDEESALGAKYGAFKNPTMGLQALGLACVCSPDSPGLPGPREPEVVRVGKTLASAAFRTFRLREIPTTGVRHYFEGLFDQPRIHAVENMLRLLVSEHLRLRSSALYHSAGLLHAGRGYLFPGISGAGKTTLALRAGRAAALSDELPAVVTASHADAKPQWQLHATPFWGDMGHGTATGYAALRAICLLEGKGATACCRATPPETMQRLLATVLCYAPDDAAAAELSAICRNLSEQVPAVVLTTTVDEPFAEVIARVEATLASG